MIDPVTGAALISAGGNLLGGMFGANESNRATNAQIAMNQMQINSQDRNNMLQRMFLAQQYNDAKMGSTDARGNRTSFIPGQGMTTTLSPQARALLEASDREELLRMTNDAPMARQTLMRNYERQGKENTAADGLLEELMRGPAMSRSDLESMYRLRMRKDMGEGYDKASNDAARTGLRTGADMSKTLSKIAKQRSEGYAGAGNEAALTANNAFDSMEGNRVSRGSSLYNMMAARASGNNNNTFQPFSTSSIDNAASTAQNKLAYAGGMQAQMNPGGYGGTTTVKPDFSNAQLLAGGGDAMSALLGMFSKRQQGNTQSTKGLEPYGPYRT